MAVKNKLIIFLLAFCATAHAQQQSSSLLRFGLHDGAILAREYLRPFGSMLGSTLNCGWYNTAGIHRIGGFDITLAASYGMVPSRDDSYNLETIAPSLQHFTLDPASANVMAPTVAGRLLDGQKMPNLLMNATQQGGDVIPVLPDGAEFDAVLLPVIQASVGVPFNSELMVRFMPQVEFDNLGKAMMWGAGLKHSLWDDIPLLRNIPFLRLSLMGGYTNLSSEVILDKATFNQSSNSFLDVSSDAFMGRIIFGAEFPVVALYGGIGYGSVKSSFGFKGPYAVSEFEGTASNTVTVSNPFSLSYSREGVDYNAGIRLKMFFLTLHADYTHAGYQVVTVGVGVSIR